MWGVGKKTQDVLGRLGIQTIGDLSRFPARALEQKLGKHGISMHRLSRGIDERDVVVAHDAKSIGNERTFAADILQIDSARKEILSLADKVGRRMRREGVAGRTITLKVKYSDFAQITRSITLPRSTDDGPEIYSAACRLLEKTQVGRRPARLLGVSLSQLSLPGPGEQLLLFHQGATSGKRKELNTALDSLSEKFGEDSIRPATLLSK